MNGLEVAVGRLGRPFPAIYAAGEASQALRAVLHPPQALRRPLIHCRPNLNQQRIGHGIRPYLILGGSDPPCEAPHPPLPPRGLLAQVFENVFGVKLRANPVHNFAK